MSEGTIVKWEKKEGDAVNAGDILCEIQTDKAVVALETEEEGTLAKIYLGDDSHDIKVGALIALIAESGEDWKSVKSEGAVASAAHSSPAPVATSQVQPSDLASTSEFSSIRHATKRPTMFGPAVRSLLEQYGITATDVTASGPQGLLLKGDVLNHIKAANLLPKTLTAHPPPSAEVPKPETPRKPSKAPHQNTKVQSEDQEFQDLELSSMRRTIAKRLTESKTGIPHAYSSIDCKMDSLLALRKQFKVDGIKLSINDVIVKAVGTALQLCPEVNVVWKGDELVQPSSVDVSVAVATENGLITPIVTDVPGRGLKDIGDQVRDLANRARLGKLKLNEFQGGSFTISNLGMYGINEFSAIINPPQCGILAVGGSRLKLGENGRPVTVMNATLSYDEGAVSSVAAAQFMSTLQNLLESPQSLLLGRSIQSMAADDE